MFTTLILKCKRSNTTVGPGEKKPVYPTKGELHVRMTAKNQCQFCTPGNWFAVQAAAGGAPGGKHGGGVAAPSLVPMSLAAPGAGGALPFGDVCLGLGWDFAPGRELDLDASVVAFGARGERLDLVYYGQLSGCGGAVRHSGDNRTGAGDGDDEVITLSLPRVPAGVVRLACVVNSYSGTSLARARSAFVRVFCGPHTLGIQKLSHVCDSPGLFFCFFQRSSTGAWFFQTVVQPVPGHIASQSIPAITQYLANIPLF